MAKVIALPDLRPIPGPQGAPGLRPPPVRTRPPRKPLGQILIDMKAVDPGDMLKALAMRNRQDVRLGDILLAHGWATEADLMAALSLQWGTRVLDLGVEPPDARLVDQIGADLCLAHGALPWRRAGAATVIATSRPDEFRRFRDALPCSFGPVVMAIASERAIHATILAMRKTALIRRAETRTAAQESCRTLDSRRTGDHFAIALALMVLGALVAPTLTFGLLFLWALVTLLLSSGLKAAAFVSELCAARRPVYPAPVTEITRLPMVSLLVPLFHEDDIAPRLIERLGRLDYPKELLDILLIVEEEDHQTQAALAGRRLPRWMRVVTVPDGPIRTKPRALNYALDFCRGAIVGVYDAEDMPDPGQIRAIVRRFHERGPQVACLQGVLDYYNSRHNWLTRCFTIEYAAWFRVMLPGIARLGFVVPLGGTTLFFRRKVLEELGGWDAHNVTEDADLGLRLARHGYRTELVPTVTEEEPNARVRSWIRQRSRWQKGYAMTWAVHMRDPARLWRELGAKRFIGVQILLLGSLSQAILAPVLWSFWSVLVGLEHPLAASLPTGAMPALGALFLASELLNIVVGAWAVRGPRHRHLLAWVPTLHLYFPLGAIASYKALWETVREPFYWDKTQHGVLCDAAEPLPPLVLKNPILILRNPVTVNPVASHRPILWTHPAPRLLAPLPEVRGSLALQAPRGTGVEFQPCFEGF